MEQINSPFSEEQHDDGNGLEDSKKCLATILWAYSIFLLCNKLLATKRL